MKKFKTKIAIFNLISFILLIVYVLKSANTYYTSHIIDNKFLFPMYIKMNFMIWGAIYLFSLSLIFNYTFKNSESRKFILKIALAVVVSLTLSPDPIAKAFDSYCLNNNIFAAIKFKDDDINSVKRLVNVNTFNKNNFEGISPLSFALIHEKFEIAEYLIKKGASVDAKNSQGSWSPLTIVSDTYKPNKVEMIKLLIKHGANVNLKNSDGKTPLLNLLGYGYTNEPGKKEKEMELVDYRSFRVLIENGADIFTEDSEKRNALSLASMGDNTLIARYVINERKLDINKQDSYGQTPLVLACEYNSTETAQLLIKSGADKNIKDSSGKTAYDYALENGNKDIVELLKD